MSSMNYFLALALLVCGALAQINYFDQTETFAGENVNDRYGQAVAISGDFAIGGKPFATITGGYTNAGLAVFLERVNGAWVETEVVESPTKRDLGYFASAVDITSNGWAVIGAHGERTEGNNQRGGNVHVYQHQNGVWTAQATINPPVLGQQNNFGFSVAINAAGDRIVVGEYADDSANVNAGAIHIYERDGSDVWQPKGKFFETELSASAYLGQSVAIVGDFVLAGAFRQDFDTFDGAGKVYVYKRDAGGSYSLDHSFVAPDPINGLDFGHAMDADLTTGTRVVVGAPGHSAGGDGAVYVFELSGGVFTHEATLKRGISATSYAGNFGQGVGIDGSLIVGGAYSEGPQNYGAAYIFELNATSGDWTELQRAQGNFSSDWLGYSVDVSGTTALFGAHQTSDARGLVLFYEDEDYVAPGGSSGGSSSGPAAPSNPLRCGEYDATNQRYFYDDGTGCEEPPTVNDACYYAAGDLGATLSPTLRIDTGAPGDDGDAPFSELKSDGGVDYIYLAFDMPDKYYNVEMVFPDAGTGECAFSSWEQVSATRDVTDRSACHTTFVYRLPWADAYSSDGSKCGWGRDVSSSKVMRKDETVTLTLDFGTRAVEDLSTRRNGTTLRRELVQAMPAVVEFPTQVAASPVNVQVFAPVRVIAAVTSQAVAVDEDSLLATLTLGLTTDVQAPFELHGMVESTESLPTGITLLTEMTGGDDDDTLRQDNECEDTASNCENTWSWQYTTPSVSNDGANPCDFDGTYQVSFSVRCSEASNTNCPIDENTDSVEITLTVSTANHCPALIESADVSAVLAVYDAPERATSADDFVGDGTQDDGQTADLNDWQVAYFAAPVTSSQVAIQRTEFNQVWITRHQETVSAADDDLVVLLDSDNTMNESPYDNVGEIDCAVVAGVGGADATATAVSAATGCSPAKDGVGGTYSFNFKHGEGGNAAAGEASTPIFEFDIRTDSEGFNMADDAIETMKVSAVIDVEYANAAKRTGGAVQQNKEQQSTVTSSFTMQTTTSSSTGSSSSTALFGMNATVLYGAGALAVVAVLAVLVVVSRRRSGQSSKMTKMESTAELTSTV